MNKDINELIESNKQMKKEIEELKKVLRDTRKDLMAHEIIECLNEMDDNNKEEKIEEAEEIFMHYNVDNINEDKLKEYVHRFIENVAYDN